MVGALRDHRAAVGVTDDEGAVALDGETSLVEIERHANALREQTVDCLIALGGGKCVDAGKAVANRLDLDDATLLANLQAVQAREGIRPDDALADVRVAGEISNFNHHTSGHIYFTLKDASAQVRCVFFRQKAMGLGFALADGLADRKSVV